MSTSSKSQYAQDCGEKYTPLNGTSHIDPSNYSAIGDYNVGEAIKNIIENQKRHPPNGGGLCKINVQNALKSGGLQCPMGNGCVGALRLTTVGWEIKYAIIPQDNYTPNFIDKNGNAVTVGNVLKVNNKTVFLANNFTDNDSINKWVKKYAKEGDVLGMAKGDFGLMDCSKKSTPSCRVNTYCGHIALYVGDGDEIKKGNWSEWASDVDFGTAYVYSLPLKQYYILRYKGKQK